MSNSLVEAINQYGFPIVAAMGLGYFVYYVWKWVTTEIKPVLGEASNTLIALIDRIRMLDNDMIRLTQKIQMVLEKTGTVLDDGSSATKGLFIVNVTENELLNLKQQFLSYNIYLVDSAGDNVLTYTDTHFGMDAVIKISSEAFPGPKDSISATSFTETGVGSGVWTSSSIDAQPGINGNEALHTAAVYTSAYTGNVVVQATLDNQVSDGTQWADIATLTFDGTETLPKPISYNGVFSYVRFKADANPNDKITKVLVRN